MSVEHVERSRVAWVDTDAGGRIHFSKVFVWAENAEIGLLRRLGLLDGSIEVPRRRVEAEYLKPLRFEDEIEVSIRVERVGRSSINYAWTISKDSEPHVTGRHTVVNVDSEGRPRSLPDDARAALGG